METTITFDDKAMGKNDNGNDRTTNTTLCPKEDDIDSKIADFMAEIEEIGKKKRKQHLIHQ